MQFDDILTQIGQFGRYQKIAFIVYGAAIATCGWQAVLIVFIGASTAFRCVTRTNDSLWMTNCNDSNIREECVELVFDRSEFISTIRSEWHLVCDRDYLVAMVQTVFMAGWLIGATVTGYISDRFGRKRSLILSTLALICSSSGAAYAPWYAAFTALRCIVGFTAGAVYTISFVLLIEVTGSKYRIYVGLGLSAWYGFGMSSTAGLAYVLRDHRHLQLVVGLLPIVFLVVFSFMPESPRWLLCMNRKSEAEIIIKKIASYNRKEIDLDELSLDATVQCVSTSANILDLVKTPNLRRVTCVIFFNWCAISLVYYGITLSGASMGSNRFLNLFLFCFVEIPGCLLGYFGIHWLGRVKLIALANIAGGLCCVAGSILIENEDLNWLLVTLSMCGKLTISGSFAAIYLYTCEVYPTVIRNIGLGTSSTWARVGGLLAPQIARIGYVWSLLPFMVFAILSIVAGLLIILAPETHGKPLPETVEQGEVFAQLSRLEWCRKQPTIIKDPETYGSLAETNLGN